MKNLLSTISLAAVGATALGLISVGSASLYTQPVREPLRTVPAAEWSIPSTPQAPKPSARTIEIVNHLSSSWDVKGGVKFVDQYTASKTKFVTKCSGKAYRCITFRSGNTPGTNLGWSSGSTITVDPAMLKYVANSATMRRWIVSHELGHQYGLGHSSGNNFMRQYKNGRPKYVATAAQKNYLHSH